MSTNDPDAWERFKKHLDELAAEQGRRAGPPRQGSEHSPTHHRERHESICERTGTAPQAPKEGDSKPVPKSLLP